MTSLPTSDVPTALLQRAVALQNAGDLPGAQAIYWRILIDQPQQFDALHLLGVSKCQQGQHAEGTWFIARALEQRPDDPGAHFNRAMALSELHRHLEAVAGFDRSLALRATDAPTWSARGDSLQTLGRNDEAITSYERALALNPHLPGTLSNLGAALLATGQPDRAASLFRDALEAGADSVTVLMNIARAHQELGQTEEAARAFDQACAAQPDAAAPRWLRAIATLPDIPGTEAEVAASRPAFDKALAGLEAWYKVDTKGRRDPLEVAWPFYLAYQDRNNRDLLARFGRLRGTLMQAWRTTQPLPVPALVTREPGPLRVGIVSPHLYSHSVWHAITRGWFAHLDPARIALHAFHTGTKSDSETEFARARAAGFTRGLRGPADWIRAIAATRPHALLYPALGMDTLSGNLAALRLAPVQLASWGHPETTGLPTIDAYLSAEAFEPPPAMADAAYTETLIRLPRLGAAFVPQGLAVLPPDLVALGLDPDRPIILCPGTPFKYAPEHDSTLAAIARGTPAAQLVFFHLKTGTPLGDRLHARIAARFRAEGLDPAAQLRLIPFQPMAQFYGLVRRATLVLDTIGFSGFNTALQVAGQHTPLIAYESGFMRGRLASGLLRTMGLDDLVATTPAGFVALATSLLHDPAAQAQTRARIAAALPALYDDRASVEALADTIETLVTAALKS